MHRFQDAGPQPLAPGPLLVPPERQTYDKGEELISPRDRRQDFQNHSASNHTPQATSAAPIQRRESTCSLSTRRARMVSITRLPAEAGTAKLKSATCTSAMKAKKDRAMHATARIRFFLRASVASTRPRPLGRKSWISPWRFISWLCSRSAMTVEPMITASRNQAFTLNLRYADSPDLPESFQPQSEEYPSSEPD